MMGAAVNLDHRLDRALFPENPPACCHALIVAALVVDDLREMTEGFPRKLWEKALKCSAGFDDLQADTLRRLGVRIF